MNQHMNQQSTFANPVQVQKFLEGVDYPVSKEELIEKARSEGADDLVLTTLQALDWDEFNSPNDVAEAIGDLEE